MPNKQQKKIILINNCIEIGLSDSGGPFSSIRISIPKKIYHCSKCKNVFFNLPNNTCTHYYRQKFCKGTPEEKDYDAFLKNSEKSLIQLGHTLWLTWLMSLVL